MKHTVTLCDVNLSRLDPVEYDAVLIGASVHAEKYPSLIERYIQKHLQSLNRMQLGLFFVSLTAASDDELLWDELKKLTIDFMQNTGCEAEDRSNMWQALYYLPSMIFSKNLLFAKLPGKPVEILKTITIQNIRIGTNCKCF